MFKFKCSVAVLTFDLTITSRCFNDHRHLVLGPVLRCGTLCTRNIVFYMDTTDSGPDQNSRKKKLAAYIHSNQPGNVIYLPGACLLHQYHLICQMGLQFVDSCLSSPSYFGTHDGGDFEFRKYFASLAAIANTWREKAAAIMEEWERQFGCEKLGRQFPQHVLQGRWGSVDSAELFYLKRGREKIQSCLLHVISQYMKADKSDKRATPKASTLGNELVDNTDEINAYKFKLSKWFATTFRALNSKIFWFLLHACHEVRKPLRHFLHFVQKHSTPKNSEHILLLLVERIECFQTEWVLQVITSHQWLQEALRASGCDSLTPSIQGKLNLMVGQLLFKTGHAFDARILKKLRQCLAFSGSCLLCLSLVFASFFDLDQPPTVTMSKVRTKNTGHNRVANFGGMLDDTAILCYITRVFTLLGDVM